MEIFIAVVILIASLFFIIKGGEIFVDSSTDIAKRFHIPQIVIGATIVSLATTLPELLISIVSSIDGTTGLAVGNSVGSVICNIALVCGIAFVVLPSKIDRGGNLKYYLVIFSSLFLCVISLFFQITIWEAIVLILISILFFVFNFLDTKKIKYKKSEIENASLKPLWLTIILFFVGAGAVAGGAYLLCDKVEYLTKVIGISEQFVGVTIVAIGTSLPELTTTLVSIKNKTPYIAVGNIIGANILNMTLILGVTRLVAFSSGVPITKSATFVSIPFAFILTLILVLPILIKKQTYRWQGIVFLSLYALYLGYLITTIFVPIF